jgi:PAS domain S-box-containing protein
MAIVSVDREQKVRTWNSTAEAMFGWSADEVLGQPLPGIPPELHDSARKALDAVFAGNGPTAHDSRRCHKDLSEIDVNILTAPVRAADGSVYASMLMIQDITERKELEREREQLLRRIVHSQEQERQRIARELHDELGQHLTALKMGLEALLPNESLQQMKTIVTRLDESIDRLALELRPPALDDLGLHGAVGSLLDQFTAASGIRADVHTTGPDGHRLSDAVETTLYRVLQEALTNIWKHAGAKNVSVIVELQPQQVQLIVEDDGSGFDPAEAPSGDRRARFGLVGMRERIALIGGSFNIESTPGQGTTLYVRVPVASATS